MIRWQAAPNGEGGNAEGTANAETGGSAGGIATAEAEGTAGGSLPGQAVCLLHVRRGPWWCFFARWRFSDRSAPSNAPLQLTQEHDYDPSWCMARPCLATCQGIWERSRTGHFEDASVSSQMQGAVPIATAAAGSAKGVETQATCFLH